MPKNRRRPQYPEAFKAQAVQLALTTDKPKHEIAADLGIGLSTLDTWLRRHRQRPPGEVTPTQSPSASDTHQALELENQTRA
jgi:transposase-like protein